MHGPVKEWIERIFIDCYEDEEKHWDLNGNFLNSRKKWYKSKNIILGYDFIGPEGPGANGFINGQCHPKLYKETKWFTGESEVGTSSNKISLRHDNIMQFDFPFVPNYLKSLNIEFECLPVWQCRRYRKKYLYILEANNDAEHWMGIFKQPYETVEFPKLISDRVLNDIRNGNAHLIINGARDGLDSESLQPSIYHLVNEASRDLLPMKSAYSKIIVDHFNMGESFLYLCKKYNIPPNNITYFTSDLISDDRYDKWCNDKKLKKDERINWITTPFMLDATVEGYKNCHPSSIRIEDIDLSVKRSKKFLCYNGYIKSHRQIVGTFLDYKNHLNDGYFSMQNPKHFIIYDEKDWDKVKYPFIHWSKKLFLPDRLKFIGSKGYLSNDKRLREKMTLFKKQLLDHDPIFLNKLPLKVDFDYDDNDDPYIGKTWGNPYYDFTDLSYYKDSYFSIVTEVEIYGWDLINAIDVKYIQGPVLISEKTFHRMAVLHPFILVGHPYSLKKLKELGFKTFSSWIDESYDEVEDESIRMYKVLNEIDKLCSKSLDELHEMYIEMWPILEHNYKRLYNYYDISLSNKVETVWNSL